MTIKIRSDEPSLPLLLEATRLGEDINISLSGGDRGHIGAVAIAQPRPSLADPQVTSASTSVITLCGHKEDRLACAVAEQVAVSTGSVVAVACGIHINRASPAQIEQVEVSVRTLVDKLIAQLISPRG